MKPSLLAIRSLAVDFIMRLYVPVIIVFAVIVTCLLAVSIWLTSFSEWWWVLVAIVGILTLVLMSLFTAMWFVIRAVAPKRTKQQKKLAKELVDKMQRLTEVAATPKIFLWFQVARDIVAPSKGGFIASVGGDTASLRPDFVVLSNSFKDAQ